MKTIPFQPFAISEVNTGLSVKTERTLQDLGVSWVKIKLEWDEIEPFKGRSNFKILDKLLESAERNGVGLYIRLIINAQWAVNVRGEYSRRKSYPPVYMDDFKAFIRRLVAFQSAYRAPVILAIGSEMNKLFWGGNCPNILRC